MNFPPLTEEPVEPHLAAQQSLAMQGLLILQKKDLIQGKLKKTKKLDGKDGAKCGDRSQWDPGGNGSAGIQHLRKSGRGPHQHQLNSREIRQEFKLWDIRGTPSLLGVGHRHSQSGMCNSPGWDCQTFCRTSQKRCKFLQTGSASPPGTALASPPTEELQPRCSVGLGT